jgi:hypothetical protein
VKARSASIEGSEQIVTGAFHDRIVGLLCPAFLTKRPVDVESIVRQLQSDWPKMPPARLRHAVALTAKDMRLRLRSAGN